MQTWNINAKKTDFIYESKFSCIFTKMETLFVELDPFLTSFHQCKITCVKNGETQFTQDFCLNVVMLYTNRFVPCFSTIQQ